MKIEKYELKDFLMKGASMLEIKKHFGTLSLESVLKNESRAGLRKLAKEWSEEKVLKAVSILIKDASRAFTKELSLEKATELAYEIYFSEYYYLSLEEIYILLSRVKTQEFSFTEAAIKKNLKLFVEERFKIAENIEYEERTKNKFISDSIKIDNFKELQREANKQFLKSKKDILEKHQQDELKYAKKIKNDGNN